MKHVCWLFAALVSASLFSPSTAHGQIISNSGFETPVLPTGQVLVFPTGGTIGSSWTVLGTAGNSQAVVLIQTSYNEPANGITAFNAQEGLNSLDLTGPFNQGLQSGVRQIITTTAGQGYQVTFYVGRASGGSSYLTPSTVDLSIDGGPRTSFTNANSTAGSINWLQFTTNFVATGSTTTLDFLNGQTTNNFTGLDNVAVVPIAVPEPSTIGLLSVSSLFLGYPCYRQWQKRRRRGSSRGKRIVTKVA